MIDCIDQFMLRFIISSTTADMKVRNFSALNFFELNILPKDCDEEVLLDISSAKERFLLLVSKTLSGSNDELCGQLIREIVMLCPSKHKRHGVTFLDHLNFFT